MSDKQYIRCDAEGRELPADATDYAIVFDPSTGLEWTADFLPKQLNHEDAGKAAAELPLAGCGWRLPTYHEAPSIVDINRYNPARDPVFRGASSGWMWTSDTVASDRESSAWIVLLDYGGVYLGSRDGTAWVRPCRARRAASQ